MGFTKKRTKAKNEAVEVNYARKRLSLVEQYRVTMTEAHVRGIKAHD